MKNLQLILWWLVAFYTIVFIGYTVWTILATGGPEWVGVVTLLLMAVFSLFIAFYLGIENKPFKGRPLVEDRLDGNIDEAEEELGHFAPHSWWPILLAGCVGLALVGASVGWWPLFFAAPLLVWAIIGWSFEYYRGHLKH